ncbi:hypothetical protein QAD02_013120 [Eretmocerus hayati]|uniref:Uncharacterized protein n=1 Tax=Eretmocerus hayati TaxID=131215 RepID=A0ACC2P1I5_9HYME|nr:hypothetical protein QAD02_013120 [Eretmocerus hayati]
MQSTGTSWIQNLNKLELIAELRQRNAEFTGDEKFEDLRKKLQKVVKKGIAEAQDTQPVSEKDKDTKNLENREFLQTTGKDSTASENDTGSTTSYVSVCSDTEDKSGQSDDDMSGDGVNLEFCLQKDKWENFVMKVG